MNGAEGYNESAGESVTEEVYLCKFIDWLLWLPLHKLREFHIPIKLGKAFECNLQHLYLIRKHSVLTYLPTACLWAGFWIPRREERQTRSVFATTFITWKFQQHSTESRWKHWNGNNTHSELCSPLGEQHSNADSTWLRRRLADSDARKSCSWQAPHL